MTTNALTSRAVVKLQMTAIIAAIGVKNQSVQPIAAADIPNAAPKPEIPNHTSFGGKKNGKNKIIL